MTQAKIRGSNNSDHVHDMHHEHVHQLVPPKTIWTDWLPLMVVIGFIVGSTLLVASITNFTAYSLLTYSMGFFFLYFALFKLIDLPGFAMGYQEYDLIARQFKPWGYLYPFIEVGLGSLYLAAVDHPLLHLVTIVLTLINCIGIGLKLAKHELFQCACLGTVLKVPLTKVSLVEYAAMGVMALVMLKI